MSDEPIQQLPAGAIRLSGERPALRMAVQYQESGQVALTKAALSPADRALRGASFGAYAIEPALYKLKFSNTIPMESEAEVESDSATLPAWPSTDR